MESNASPGTEQRGPHSSLATWPPAQVNVRLPLPLNARLEALVKLANSSGAGTRRKEILAALVLAAVTEPRVLSKLVARYRTAEAAEAARGLGDVDVLSDVTYSRGPRRSR